MRRASSDGAASRKLVDILGAGPDIGPATAVLATTFDLNPDFFETDFLPSLLGIPAADDRRWRTRIQLESELARLDSVAVLMEATRWNGRPRTLRVHVQPARAEDRGVLHAKIVLIVHDNAVRLVVGSANLTKPGYRENREVAVSLIATKKTRENGTLIRQALAGIEDRLRPWWTDSADAAVRSARVVLGKLGPPLPLEDDWFVWGGDERPLIQQVLAAWPETEPVRRMRIVSPFWSQESGSGPLARLLRGLSDRGASTADASVMLVTSAKPDGTQTWRPALPETYATFDFATLGVQVSAVPAKVVVDAEDVGRDDTVARRELHAKVLLLEGPKTTLGYCGSANFTSSGWGFGTARGSNLEAGILMRRQGKARAAFEALVPPLEGEPVRLQGSARAIVTVPVDFDAGADWPHFVHSVELRPESGSPERLELVVALHPALAPATWSVAIGLDAVPRETTVSSTSAAEHRSSLSADDLRALIELQAVQVRWEGGPETGVSYPLNVSLSARERIPFGDVRLLPSENDLVAFYQGRIAFEDLFPPPSGEDEADPQAPVVTAESAVDTSRIVSYQVRAFVEALTGLRDELARNTVTERSMRLAILGPVSPVALAREIERAAKEGRSVIAAGFQLAELIGVLRSALSFPVDPMLMAIWTAVVRDGEADVAKRLAALRESCPVLADGTAFGAYVRATSATHGVA